MELVLTYKNILANKKLKMCWNFESVGGNVGGIWTICKYIGVSKCLRVSNEFISTNTLSGLFLVSDSVRGIQLVSKSL